MVVSLDKKHSEIINKVIKDVNKKGNSRKIKKSKSYDKYDRITERKGISVEQKKKELIKHLYTLLIETFAHDVKKVNRGRVLNHIKNNLRILRNIVIKLKNINYYQESTFLEDIGYVKIRPFVSMRKADFNKLMKEDKEVLNKKDMDKLEHVVFKLIDNILIFDRKLLKKYVAKEKIVKSKENLTRHELRNILRKESELFRHLESKLPPAKHVRSMLLQPKNYTPWVSRILSLMVTIEHYHQKEGQIITKLKKGRVLKARIEQKINKLVKEKWEILKIKENKVLGIQDTLGLDKEWQKMTHDWSTVSQI